MKLHLPQIALARREILLFPLFGGVMARLADAQTPSLIYIGYPPGGNVWMTAAVIAEALSKQLSLPYKAEARAGDFSKIAVKAFDADANVENKLILASPSASVPFGAKAVAIVGEMRGLSEPFGLYADRRMPDDRAKSIGDVVQQLVRAGTIPRSA